MLPRLLDKTKDTRIYQKRICVCQFVKIISLEIAGTFAFPMLGGVVALVARTFHPGNRKIGYYFVRDDQVKFSAGKIETGSVLLIVRHGRNHAGELLLLTLNQRR